MAQILVLSAGTGRQILPALELLSHQVRFIPAEPASLVGAPSADLIFLDACGDLNNAKNLAKILNTTGLSAPLVIIVNESGLAALSAEWGSADFILNTAGPGEVDARIRLALGRQAAMSMFPLA